MFVRELLMHSRARLTMPDPLGRGFTWSEGDVDALERHMARAMTQGKFHADTVNDWRGDDVWVQVSGSLRRQSPEDVRIIFEEWDRLHG